MVIQIVRFPAAANDVENSPVAANESVTNGTTELDPTYRSIV